MAGIIDSLVSHLEARIIRGDSKERISPEVLAEFYSGTAESPVKPVISTPKQQEPVPVEEPIQTPVIPVQQEPAVQPFKPEVPRSQPAVQVDPAADLSTLSLTELRVAGNSCSACKFTLGEVRSKDIAISESAKLMVITEPSGRSEDHMKDPFHGEAGELFLKMVQAMKIDLNETYICMAHKCFGPGAREKIVETRPYLEKQIELVKPDVILIFGGAALNILLGEQSLMKNRGRWLEVNGIPTLATYPPAYLQQKAEAKKEAWSDMQQVMARLSV